MLPEPSFTKPTKTSTTVMCPRQQLLHLCQDESRLVFEDDVEEAKEVEEEPEELEDEDLQATSRSIGYQSAHVLICFNLLFAPVQRLP